MSSTAAQPAPRKSVRSPLAQLLHDLNQPLTGLQCLIEVALAIPRSSAEYVPRFREGLELTERMRILVAGIREVVDDGEKSGGEQDSSDLDVAVRGAVAELAIVGQAKGVQILYKSPAIGLCTFPVRMGKAWLEATVFRLLDSILCLATTGTQLRIALDSRLDDVGLKLEWQEQGPRSEWCAAQVGLLVAQAQFERAGADWEVLALEEGEAWGLTVRLPCEATRRNLSLNC